MSNSAVNALACATGLCGNACGMHQVKSAAPTPKSCCPEKALPKSEAKKFQKSACNCVVRSSNEAVQNGATVAAIQFELIADVHFGSIEPNESAPVICAKQIFYWSDSSPPTVGRHPDLGRAPPIA